MKICLCWRKRQMKESRVFGWWQSWEQSVLPMNGHWTLKAATSNWAGVCAGQWLPDHTVAVQARRDPLLIHPVVVDMEKVSTANCYWIETLIKKLGFLRESGQLANHWNWFVKVLTVLLYFLVENIKFYSIRGIYVLFNYVHSWLHTLQ